MSASLVTDLPEVTKGSRIEGSIITLMSVTSEFGMTGAEAKEWNVFIRRIPPPLLLFCPFGLVKFAPGQQLHLIWYKESKDENFKLHFTKPGERIPEGLVGVEVYVRKGADQEGKSYIAIWKERLLEIAKQRPDSQDSNPGLLSRTISPRQNRAILTEISSRKKSGDSPETITRRKPH